MMDEITSKHQDGINRMMKKEYVKLHCFIGTHHVAPNIYKAHDDIVNQRIEDLLRKNKNLRKSLNSSIETFKELNNFANSQLTGNCPVSELKAILKGFDV